MRVLAEPSPREILRRLRAARTFWLLLGLVLVGIGFIGIVVPLLPTTDFVLQFMPTSTRGTNPGAYTRTTRLSAVAGTSCQSS